MSTNAYRRTRVATPLPMVRTCTSCTKTFPERSFGSKQRHDERCDACILKNTRCKYCRITFTASYFSDNVCSPCAKTRDALHEDHCTGRITGKFTDDMIYPDYKLIVTYDVEAETHDGYCSDPFNERTTTNTITVTYPLLKKFKMSDIIDDDHIDTSNSILQMYYTKDTECHGNGYCGCYTNYLITDARVTKKSNIQLDD